MMFNNEENGDSSVSLQVTPSGNILSPIISKCNRLISGNYHLQQWRLRRLIGGQKMKQIGPV